MTGYRRLVIGTLTLLLIAASADAAARPNCAGIELPVPRSAPVVISTDSVFTTSGFRHEQFTLLIDTAGNISGLEPVSLLEYSFQKKLERIVRRIQFWPCRRHDSVLACRIPAILYLGPDSAQTEMRLPIQADSSVGDNQLYRDGLKEAGLKPASVKRFPWFHATFKRGDSVAMVPYALVKLSLSAKGTVKERSLVRSNFPNYADQILNASLWGTYAPAMIGKTAVPTTAYLMVSFFPTLPYPTHPYNSAKPDTADYHKRLQLQMLPDSTSLLVGPIPRSPLATPLSVPVPKGLDWNPLLMRCHVDTLGQLSLSLGVSGKAEIDTFLSQIAGQQLFFPAMDFSGRPRAFDGYAEASITNALTIRIDYFWLH